jgi:hypothetical protein
VAGGEEPDSMLDAGYYIDVRRSRQEIGKR